MDRLATRLRRWLGNDLKVDEPMAAHTTIGVGGPAKLLATPRTMGQVARVVKAVNEYGIELAVVGRGSNLIVRDSGFDGLIMKMTNLADVKVNKRTVRAEGGASFARLARTMTRQGRTGLEFGIGIPGSVGGAVRMNAGAFGGEVKDVLRRVKLVTSEGVVQVLKGEDIEFSYRKSKLPAGSVVLSATFDCAPGKIDQQTYDRSIGRKESQPIAERSFGSTFVNPPGGFAAQMIEACGLKGRQRGGAQFSSKHANFIVNINNQATASDVEYLIRLAQREVKKKFGVSLHTEVVIIGNR